jgi:hypothetical protein
MRGRKEQGGVFECDKRQTRWQLAIKAQGLSRGRPKKSGGPWVYEDDRQVGRSEAKKGPGPSSCFDLFFLWCSYTPLTDKRPKKVIKENREKIGFGFLSDFFGKHFSTRFFGKKSCLMFLNSHR